MKKNVVDSSSLHIGSFNFRPRGRLVPKCLCSRLIALSRCRWLESAHFSTDYLLAKTNRSILFHISWRCSHDHFFIDYCRIFYFTFLFRFLSSWRSSYPLLLILCYFCSHHCWVQFFFCWPTSERVEMGGIIWKSFLFYNNEVCNNGCSLRLYIAIIILPLFKMLEISN